MATASATPRPLRSSTCDWRSSKEPDWPASMDKADPRDDQAGAFRLLAEPSEEPIAVQEPALSLQERMHLFLVENLHHGLTLKDLSEFLGYSEKYCSEWFVARMGQSFSSYVKRLRVERATRLLGSSGRLADIGPVLVSSS